MTYPIRGNGFREIIIDVGHLNCMEEPYHINLGEGVEFILRFDCSARKGDFGKIKLERMAK